MKPPAVLVSPSMIRGYDFPGEECEVVVIGKVPWPDGRGAISKARGEIDPQFPAWAAITAVQQEAGRAVRSEWDRCEIFIVDDDWEWFWKRNWKMAAGAFRDAVTWGGKMQLRVPVSPPKLPAKEVMAGR